MHLERVKGKLIGEFGCMCVCVWPRVCVYVHASVGVHKCVACVRVLCGNTHAWHDVMINLELLCE